LVSAALRLAGDPDLRCDMGRNARRLLEQSFSVEHAVDQIFVHLHESRLIIPSGSSKTGVLVNPGIHPSKFAEHFEP